MKRIVLIFTLLALGVGFIACNSNSKAGKNEAPVVSATDTIGLAEFQALKAQAALAAVTAQKTAAPVSSSRKVATKKVYSGGGSRTSETMNTAKAPQKKGWSKAAKGTAIGAASGAVLGAVINKRNRALGAVIGGVAGGGIGYGIGRHLDKKDGRY